MLCNRQILVLLQLILLHNVNRMVPVYLAHFHVIITHDLII